MEIRDQLKFAEWQLANQSPYGQRVMQFATAWAEAMEGYLGTGTPVAAVAAPTRKDLESQVSGAMYASAVAMLAACWRWGEDLLRWHNQLVSPAHGDEATARGAVLAPGLLTFDAAPPRTMTPVQQLPSKPFPADVPGELGIGTTVEQTTLEEPVGTKDELQRDASNGAADAAVVRAGAHQDS